MPLTPATPEEIEAIKSKYVTPQHFERITEYSKRTNLAVSFREAGDHTISRIEENSGRKPHTILEKSIKESSIVGLYSDIEKKYKEKGADKSALERQAKVRFEEGYSPGGSVGAFDTLKGYIGAWEPNGAAGKKLVGVYITKSGMDTLNQAAATAKEKPEGTRTPADLACIRASEAIAPRGDMGHSMLKLGFKDAPTGTFPIQDLAQLPGMGKGMFFTGDYDLHEMAKFDGIGTSTKPHHILADSPEEKAHLGLLSGFLTTGTMGSVGSQPKVFGERSDIQHGAQGAFIAHMLNEERGKPLPESVARMSPGVAMCDRGKWYLFKSVEENREWYKSVGLELKSTWSKDDARIPEPATGPAEPRVGQSEKEKVGLQGIEESRIITKFTTAPVHEKHAALSKSKQ